MKKLSILFPVFAITACANTGATYIPIVDGTKTPAFYSDLEDCQAVATERGYFNDDTKNDALLGTALGALLGAVDGDVVGGAVVGGAAGAGAGAYKAKDQRKNVVVKCMQGRGHRVVG